MDKLKLLIFGSIQDEGLFLSKLNALQKSKAGPFDCAFCVGKSSVVDKLLLLQKDSDVSLPIPVYLHDTLSPIISNISSSKGDNGTENDNSHDEPREIAPNLFILPSTGGIWSLPIAQLSSSPNKKSPLVVASCPWNLRVDDDVVKNKLLKQLQHVSYRGCDLLLSHCWPQGVEALVEEVQLLPQQQPLTSYDVAHVALQARARYHVAAGSYFGQSAPFEHLAATTNTVPCFHIGRFLSMAPVMSPSAAAAAATVSTPQNQKKLSKFVHALGIVPLQASSPAELQAQRPAQVRPSPFTDSSYQITGNSNNDKNKTGASLVPAPFATGGLSEASARRILHQEQQQRHAGPQAHRWAMKKRAHHDDDKHDDEQSVDPNNTVLFVHGLHQDVSGRLQMPQTGDALLMRYLQPKGCIAVQRPHASASTSFCFLEFATHVAAATFLQETGGSFDIEGVALTVKWRLSTASGMTKQQQQQQSHKRPRLTEANAKDSSCVYFKLPSTVAEDARTDAGEELRKSAEATLEDALAPDGDAERVTAETEPALQVKVRIPKTSPHETLATGDGDATTAATSTAPVAASFGFLDFASHAAASMTLATLTGSTDGGRLLDEAKGIPSDAFQGLYLHWARDDSSKQQQQKQDDERNIIEDTTSGFRFERKHFPPDGRKDCWFCLASEDCEKHLITGVYHSCYAAMPKGAVHPGHLLLIPVKHSSQGALTDPVVAEEMEQLKTKLRRHASTEYDRDLFVFERAIQTKHGYHTHVQCVPIERQLGVKVQATMLVQARKLGIELREINSDIGLQALIISGHGDNDDGNDSEGYFYAEIPAAGLECKRFLYQQKRADGHRSSVPLQFGREIIAAVLGKPDLAHWKACVVDKEQETAMAAKFRDSFASYE